MNNVVYHIASFMILREPTIWRWSHTRHHTDTIIVGRDPEIAATRPPDILGLILRIFAFNSGAAAIGKLLLHSIGGLTKEEETFVPDVERSKVYLVARIYLAVFVVVIGACFRYHTILPAMYIGLPTFYGGLLVPYFALTQHAGLAEGRARSSAQHAHGLHESDLSFPLLEHELPFGASPLSNGALSRTAKATRGDQGRLPASVQKFDRGLSGDHSDTPEAGEEPALLREARATALRQDCVPQLRHPNRRSRTGIGEERRPKSFKTTPENE
jgi:hypothetical protein